MELICSNLPCFFANETKTEATIPLIYQNPQHFYFPYQLDDPRKSKSSKKLKKYDSKNESTSNRTQQNIIRVKSQASINQWSSQNISASNNSNKLNHKSDNYQKQVKQNMNPSANGVFPKQRATNIYFKNVPQGNKSSQKLFIQANKTNESSRDLSQFYPQKYSYNKAQYYNIVPVSQFHSLIQKNGQMKRIIEQDYRPLKSCYESLRKQQKDRQNLIMSLQFKVKELGQKLNQRSANTIKYISY